MRYDNIQYLHFIECDMRCYGALKSNIDQGFGLLVNIAFQCSIIRDYYMTFSILALVSARDSHITPDSEAGGMIWVEG